MTGSSCGFLSPKSPTTASMLASSSSSTTSLTPNSSKSMPVPPALPRRPPTWRKVSISSRRNGLVRMWAVKSSAVFLCGSAMRAESRPYAIVWAYMSAKPSASRSWTSASRKAFISFVSGPRSVSMASAALMRSWIARASLARWTERSREVVTTSRWRSVKAPRQLLRQASASASSVGQVRCVVSSWATASRCNAVSRSSHPRTLRVGKSCLPSA